MSTGQSSADRASSWRPAPGPQSLLPSEIHVWRIRRDGSGADVRWTCRKLLLELLGRYAGLPPDQIRMVRGPFGKPEMDQGTIQFNVSHSGGLALIAMAAGRRIGVDLEEIRADVRMEDLARSFFTAEEQASIWARDGEARARAFYACWTRREAEIKAWGGSIAALKAGVQKSPGEWVLQDLPVGEGYAAALCCNGRPARVALWDWSQAGVGP